MKHLGKSSNYKTTVEVFECGARLWWNLPLILAPRRSTEQVPGLIKTIQKNTVSKTSKQKPQQTQTRGEVLANKAETGLTGSQEL